MTRAWPGILRPHVLAIQIAVSAAFLSLLLPLFCLYLGFWASGMCMLAVTDAFTGRLVRDAWRYRDALPRVWTGMGFQGRTIVQGRITISGAAPDMIDFFLSELAYQRQSFFYEISLTRHHSRQAARITRHISHTLFPRRSPQNRIGQHRERQSIRKRRRYTGFIG